MSIEMVHTEHMVDDEMDAYERFQIDKYGTILNPRKGLGFSMEVDEALEMEREKFEEELSVRAERLLDDHWGY